MACTLRARTFLFERQEPSGLCFCNPAKQFLLMACRTFERRMAPGANQICLELGLQLSQRAGTTKQHRTTQQASRFLVSDPHEKGEGCAAPSRVLWCAVLRISYASVVACLPSLNTSLPSNRKDQECPAGDVELARSGLQIVGAGSSRIRNANGTRIYARLQDDGPTTWGLTQAPSTFYLPTSLQTFRRRDVKARCLYICEPL